MKRPQLIEKRDLLKIRAESFFWGAVIFFMIGIAAGYAWHMKAAETNFSILKTDLINLQNRHDALMMEHGKWVATYPNPNQRPVIAKKERKGL